MDTLRAVFVTCLITVTGTALGTATSYARLLLLNNVGVTSQENWRTSPQAGSAEANGNVRSRIALHDPLAMNRTEAEYFYSTADSTGVILNSSCDYLITGDLSEANWWSLTLYDRRGRLLPGNPSDYSYSLTGWSQSGQEELAIRLTIPAQHTAAGDEIGQPSPKTLLMPAGNQPFRLVLGIYRPNISYRLAETPVSLPAVAALCKRPEQ